jgi:hypothetical protein
MTIPSLFFWTRNLDHAVIFYIQSQNLDHTCARARAARCGARWSKNELKQPAPPTAAPGARGCACGAPCASGTWRVRACWRVRWWNRDVPEALHSEGLLDMVQVGDELPRSGARACSGPCLRSQISTVGLQLLFRVRLQVSDRR